MATTKLLDETADRHGADLTRRRATRLLITRLRYKARDARAWKASPADTMQYTSIAAFALALVAGLSIPAPLAALDAAGNSDRYYPQTDVAPINESREPEQYQPTEDLYAPALPEEVDGNYEEKEDYAEGRGSGGKKSGDRSGNRSGDRNRSGDKHKSGDRNRSGDHGRSGKRGADHKRSGQRSGRKGEDRDGYERDSYKEY